MKIAITGCNGKVGRRVVLAAVNQGHTVIGIDRAPPAIQDGLDFEAHPAFTFLKVDLRVYEETLKALEGCEAVIQLAAFPQPGDYVAITHNNNVVISWNILRSAAELGITRVAQASTVNVIAMVFSKEPRVQYFPIDEEHPCLPDEPYGLSKMISELQADALVRRYPFMQIASLRPHWSVPTRGFAEQARQKNPDRAAMDLWGYVHQDSAAEAFLLAVSSEKAKWEGHERFFIVSPFHTNLDPPDAEVLREKYWKDVPVKEGKDVTGRRGFFDCGKAERLLGWKHRDYE
ncbi:hypothetical protein JAAARDRAFT_131334 [Jaapia argillacea MUCL 33604]|uniref:NAD-dependent epimerase/dehydratase domain-containing protein n=1 Tax=Jaapia argillacea MUCL 33604 TaxID=933084 RepID=A0A067Q0I6_9AGAM|nr:hypothetical protein JAAARDRAFT_131334 [Jaapia argillacea MUCL 33604]